MKLKAKYGKGIQRSEYQEYINQNKERIQSNKDYYRKRQAIVEHPYGTIKRQWGFSYILTKKYIKRAEADVGLIFTAYNLRRIMNIINKDLLKAYLRAFITVITRIKGKLRPYDESEYCSEIYQVFNDSSVNQLKFTSVLNYNGGF
jgi:hypothetical protein